MKLLITCPPMLGSLHEFNDFFKENNINVTAPDVKQTLSVSELISIVPNHDGWIIGDDPATHEVFKAGKKGKLKAAVKWGIGTDNIDFNACEALDIPITNTPNMFGNEVADIALGYIIGLARETFFIHSSIKKGEWPKICGISLYGKTVAIIGNGDIGSSLAKRLEILGMKINIYDPKFINTKNKKNMNFYEWPKKIDEADFLVITCSLNNNNYHMVNQDIFNTVKNGLRIVNVARGPLIDEKSLVTALKDNRVYSAALDVYETEPLPLDSYLRNHPRCIFGSHNASNTKDAVLKTSLLALKKIVSFIKDKENG